MLAYEQYRDQDTQKLCQPAQEEAEVVAGGGEDGVGAIALGSLEIITPQAVLGLEMADDGLDGGAALHLAANGGGDPADLARDPDPELVRVIVAPVSLVDMNAPGLDAGELLEIGDNGTEGMAILRVSVQRLGMEDELAAFR